MAVCFEKDSDPGTRKITGLPDVRVGRIGQYDREYAPEMLVDEPYCPFKADVWYLGRMLNIDMVTNIKGFMEKHLKAVCEEFSFDEVFGKHFYQDTIQTEEIMQVFDEYTGKFNEVEGSIPKEALKLALSLLAMIAQMRLSNPALRPDMAQLLDTVLAFRKSSSHEVLSDYIGIQKREVEWEKW